MPADPQRKPEPHENAATTDYAGCPHCGGPVNIARNLERAKHDLLTDLQTILAQRPTHAQIRAAVEGAQAEAYERLHAPALALRGPGA